MFMTRQSYRLRASITAFVAVAMFGTGMLAQAPAAAQTRTTETQYATFRPALCGTYTVKPGDWLSAIGNRFGLAWQYLAAVNHLANPNLIFPGQQIALCATKTVPTTSTPPATTHAAVKPATHQTAAAKPAWHAAPTHNAAAAHPASYPAQTGTLSSVNWGGEPCRSGVYATGPISAWKIPPGCYGGVYYINPAHYVARGGFGQCSWWPQVLHPNDPGILMHGHSGTPAPGAVIYFAPGVQGASAGGHYGEVVAVLGGGWLLISEMNDTWRGAGWGRVNYRYVRQGPGVSFIYG